MNIKYIFQVIVQNWAIRRLTPANVQAVLAALLSRLREFAESTEIKFDDWALDFLESVVQDSAKIEKLTEFIRSKLAGVYMDVPPACDGPVNGEYQNLAASLTCDGMCETSLDTLIKIGRFLSEIIPVLLTFFKESEQ